MYVNESILNHTYINLKSESYIRCFLKSIKVRTNMCVFHHLPWKICNSPQLEAKALQLLCMYAEWTRFVWTSLSLARLQTGVMSSLQIFGVVPKCWSPAPMRGFFARCQPTEKIDLPKSLVVFSTRTMVPVIWDSRKREVTRRAGVGPPSVREGWLKDPSGGSSREQAVVTALLWGPHSSFPFVEHSNGQNFSWKHEPQTT